MKVKIGLRTTPYGPRVTSVVRSLSSTPMRHDVPIASCDHSVPARPAR